MRTEYWIKGSPDKFEQGMRLFDIHDVWGIVVSTLNNGSCIAYDETGALGEWALNEVSSYCPTIPLKEAEAAISDALSDANECPACCGTGRDDDWECPGRCEECLGSGQQDTPAMWLMRWRERNR